MTYYSQFGEDQWIIENTDLPEKGFFIDIGAADGEHYSNTLHLEEKGWDGLCIEADYRAYHKLVSRRKQTLNVAVRDYDGVTDLYLGEDSDLSRTTPTNMFHKSVAPCLRLTTILQDLRIKHIDLLSIDIEGIELEVLKTLTIFPRFLIVEYFTRGIGDHKEELIPFLSQLGYKVIHTTESNLILCQV